MLIKVIPFVNHLNRFISPAGRNTAIVLSNIKLLEEKNPIKYPHCDIYERILPNKDIALLRGNRNFSQFFMVSKDKIRVVTRKLVEHDNHSELIITKMNLSDPNKNKKIIRIVKKYTSDFYDFDTLKDIFQSNR